VQENGFTIAQITFRKQLSFTENSDYSVCGNTNQTIRLSHTQAWSQINVISVSN